MRSRLGRVKGLGSAHEGVHHGWQQRVTAVALLPLSLWFVASLVTALMSPDVIHVAEWFSSPLNSILMILLLGVTFMHARLGAQVVIEDYIRCPASKYTLLLANTFISYAFAGISILAVLKLHFLDVATSM